MTPVPDPHVDVSRNAVRLSFFATNHCARGDYAGTRHAPTVSQPAPHAAAAMPAACGT
ncbi:hypothetical protein XAC3810_530034 [Xanthomonas citri pv. citri]|uniref:Uncharacterized protein n=1 Tax=Xanthomonas citri pv. citri TaxID=611301 RepID=A0A0U5FGB2_XANCI|nr:hypothetical protein XAC9322_530033 [Xanthomonas citri pv. citri]CEE31628.1 hypothetical protein XAC3824_670034 [Xanthomonas citri pv. citri]CEE42475.1 hypothetical protein XAC3810_530034 [Xanthomonas citri pv. citri]CEE44285.1 hypothetical protein XAC902_690034 [Xanthomonas citri pv. citri]CEE45251.1 hypothetical protein XAC2911_600034 [Xanthomonas citri pv. citri]